MNASVVYEQVPASKRRTSFSITQLWRLHQSRRLANSFEFMELSDWTWRGSFVGVVRGLPDRWSGPGRARPKDVDDQRRERVLLRNLLTTLIGTEPAKCVARCWELKVPATVAIRAEKKAIESCENRRHNPYTVRCGSHCRWRPLHRDPAL